MFAAFRRRSRPRLRHPTAPTSALSHPAFAVVCACAATIPALAGGSLGLSLCDIRDGHSVITWINPGPPAQATPAPRDVAVRVDPRIELLSIVFRLAGNPEYNQGKFTSYLDDIERHFGPHRDHPIFEYARNLRRTRGVSFDAVMGMAIHIDAIDTLGEDEPFDDPNTALDQRWTIDAAREFLRLLREFSTQSNAAAFFEQHSGMYAMIESRMKAMLAEHADFAWFDAFFGARPGASFTLIPSLVNGGQNYGPRIRRDDGREDFFAIIGAWLFDDAGFPIYDQRVVPTVVHEFGHSFVNDVVAKRRESFRAAGERIYPVVAQGMRRQAYGNWETMINESLVRASVVRYIRAHDGEEAATRAAKEEEDRRFLWMTDLAALLGEYEASRDEYPTFESFMPRVIEFFDAVANDLAPD
jgi:hypothetical protein